MVILGGGVARNGHMWGKNEKWWQNIFIIACQLDIARQVSVSSFQRMHPNGFSGWRRRRRQHTQISAAHSNNLHTTKLPFGRHVSGPPDRRRARIVQLCSLQDPHLFTKSCVLL